MTKDTNATIIQGMSIKILGIETSCDETAVAIVEDGRRIMSNIVASQVDIHARYGGIVPELASRQHVIHIAPATIQALEEAGIGFGELNAVAVTSGPGLAGSLLVGLNYAKGLAFSLGIPFLGINHLEGHIYSAWLYSDQSEGSADPDTEPGFPYMCLTASGGHTDLVLMEGHGKYRLLGRTRDDAAGEAFDKAARILGLGFPGGPEIQRVASGALSKEWLPRAWLKNTQDFSFSGVKTALFHLAQARGVYPPQGSTASGDEPGSREDQNSSMISGEEINEEGLAVTELAAAFQESVVDVLVSKTSDAADKWGARGIILGGGVTANALLRDRMAKHSQLPTLIPPPVLCTDNGAMIAACGFHHFTTGLNDGLDLELDPSLSLG